MLVDSELVLRPLKESDSELLFLWRNQLEYIKNTKSFRLPKHEGLEREWVNHMMLEKSNSTVFFIITADEASIGLVQLSNIDWISRNAYFGIALCDDSAKSKGYGRRVTKLVLDYAFNELNLHKISVEILDFNLSSIHLFESIGFIKEGVMREHYFWSNTYHDVNLYGLLKEDYR